MAQDKSAEIINFSGAAEPPQPLAPETATPSGGDAGEAPSLEDTLEDLGAGAFLRAAREGADLTIEAASGATKVKAEHLEAIEWMRLDRLPALPYVTGFVKTYARYLGLDAEAVAAKFKSEAMVVMPASAPSPVREEPQGEGARLGSVFAIFVVLMFALWIGYQVLAGGGKLDGASAPPPRPEQQQTQQINTPAPASPAPQDDPEAQASASEAVSELPEEETLLSSPDGAAPPETQEAAPAENETPATVVAEPVETAPPVAETRERPLPRRARPVRQPVVIEAELTRAAAPDYPNRCTRGADDTESVTIRFDVSAEGRAVNARVMSSTNDCFETEALRTVGRWRFQPRTVDGASAVEAGKTATVNFLK